MIFKTGSNRCSDRMKRFGDPLKLKRMTGREGLAAFWF
jgi:hypothetical protein